MAFANLTFLTIIFSRLKDLLNNKGMGPYNKKNYGFHCFYDFFFNGEALFIYRSFFQSWDVINNLYNF